MSLDSVSFCCVVKDEEKYIGFLLESLLKASKKINQAEFIFIDDFSSDNTFKILKDKSVEDSRFKVKRNSEPGKVIGTNLAFSLAELDYVKFIDGDDLINGNFEISETTFSCLYHDYLELSNKALNYKKVGNWMVKDRSSVLREFRSIPKAMFIFKRTFLNKYFPIPTRLPFEDLWINFAASQDKNLIYLPKPFYIYRQHDSQYYGTLKNFNDAKRKRMAKRFESYYQFFLDNETPFDAGPKKEVRYYFDILQRKNLFSIFLLLSSPKLFVKAFVYNIPSLAKFLWRKT
mgnify:CR=1 FL=1|tara:strand:- start:11881 stop:12747 length:867 start_codon:yes stop_codon:yes gene_type:complete